MNARILFILLVISVLLAFTRRYRKLGMGCSVALLLLLVWFNIRVPASMDTPMKSSRSSGSIISVRPDAQLQSLQLEGNGAPWRLHGRVQNISTVAIRSLNVHVQRFDCPALDASQTDCKLLWQGVRALRLTVSAGSIANINESFYSHDAVPRLTGVARDQFSITAIE